MGNVLCSTGFEVFNFSCTNIGSHGCFKSRRNLELCWINGVLITLHRPVFSFFLSMYASRPSLMWSYQQATTTLPAALSRQTRTLLTKKMSDSHLLIPKLRYSTSDLYMTPYSTIISHWPAVVAIGCVGTV